jgi:hypothetical protein
MLYFTRGFCSSSVQYRNRDLRLLTFAFCLSLSVSSCLSISSLSVRQPWSPVSGENCPLKPTLGFCEGCCTISCKAFRIVAYRRFVPRLILFPARQHLYHLHYLRLGSVHFSLNPTYHCHLFGQYHLCPPSHL